MMDTNTYHYLKNFITNRCGLYFKDHDLRNLKAAVAVRMKSCGIDSIPAYYTYLTTSGGENEPEFRELLNLLTINHTYFFRNEPHFNALKEKVLPDIIRKKREESIKNGETEKPRIRIWSAGCSTGEEPYSIAMTICDVIEDLNKWDIKIYAMDASTDALEHAKKGIYGKNSMRLVDSIHREKYFKTIPGEGNGIKHVIHNSIKDMVFFKYFNLNDSYSLNDFDIIFCRNVVIYFELKTTIRIMNRFYSSLSDDGYIFIGYSESLQYISKKFKMAEWKDAIFYHRLSNTRNSCTADNSLSDVEEADKILEDISRAEVAAEKPVEKRLYDLSGKEKRIEEFLVRIIKAIHSKEYDKSLFLIHEAQAIDNKVELFYLTAEVYANRGSFDEAREFLKQALDRDSLFTPAYYLMGSVYTEMEDLAQAGKNFKKALYLDKDFIMAHFGLATVYKKEARFEDTLRAYRNTLKILSVKHHDEIIGYSGGLNTGTLINVCKNNLERIKREE